MQKIIRSSDLFRKGRRKYSFPEKEAVKKRASSLRKRSCQTILRLLTAPHSRPAGGWQENSQGLQQEKKNIKKK